MHSTRRHQPRPLLLCFCSAHMHLPVLLQMNSELQPGQASYCFPCLCFFSLTVTLPQMLFGPPHPHTQPSLEAMDTLNLNSRPWTSAPHLVPWEQNRLWFISLTSLKETGCKECLAQRRPRKHRPHLSSICQSPDHPWDFLGSSVVENPDASAGDTGNMGSIPESGRSPGGGNGNPPQDSCLKKPHWQRNLAG